MNASNLSVNYLNEYNFICDEKIFEKFPHYFFDRSLSYSVTTSDRFKSKLCRLLNLSSISMLTQVHGDKFIEVDGASNIEQPSADAFVISNSLKSNTGGYLIKTADCLPVMIFGTQYRAIIHAGWRGLAAGIFEKVINRYFLSDDHLQVLIGPAASSCCYEVGLEVIEQLGSSAVFLDAGDKKAKLDLAKTAQNQIKNLLNSELALSNICTICNPNYNSYRRDSKSDLRNVSLIL